MYSDILDTASLKSFEKLTWSHYRVLLQVKDDKARTWYEKEAAEQTWSVKTLQRNISSQYYYRMLSSQNPSVVEAEMKELTADYQNDKLEFIKNPIIAEFLGMTQNTDFTESKLENISSQICKVSLWSWEKDMHLLQGSSISEQKRRLLYRPCVL